MDVNGDIALINRFVDNKITEAKKLPAKKESEIEFQIIDWNYYHELDDDDEYVYTMQLFGRTMSDKDICLRITGFTPFFYIEIPEDWDMVQVDDLVENLKNKISYRFKNNPNYVYDYDLSKSLTNYKIVEKHKFYGFTNKKKFKFLMMGFKSYIAMKEFTNILANPVKMYTKGFSKSEEILFQRYESNIEPHIRFMHINNLSSCGWVQIDRSHLSRDQKYSYCDLNYSVNWKFVKPSTGDPDRMSPFKIMGYDIECISCDHNFCQATRPTDKIIQIGVTMYRYGSLKCYDQHILTLGDCDAIDNANVECYKTEKALLKGFANKIMELRPDFKTGYNIFGFDDQYIFDRIELLDKETARKKKIPVENLEEKDSLMDYFLGTMGKLNNKYIKSEYGAHFIDREAVGMTHGITKYLTYYKSKNLSSAALGDNILNFFQVPGVITVDMMKIIQRDHKLLGYKLDNVSANFITEKAEKIVTDENPDRNLIRPKKKASAHRDVSADMIPIQIYTKSTKALELESYIQIMVNDGYSSSPLSENAKYKVTSISEVKEGEVMLQAVHTEISQKDYKELCASMSNKLFKVFWTFAKDDMHHTLINKYFNEKNTEKISLVAKYCLKDCKLVNLLMAKLEIIVNNLGMAQVCHVPLSYLFLRGQGVKIFSLVAKKCREENFLMPVLRAKKQDADGDDDTGYEGATVITPKPGVYLSPIGVLDFSSLYPNSMRERNLSQEMYVSDPAFDNLPGYKYHDISITLKDDKGRIRRNLDNSPMKEYHRFAQKVMDIKPTKNSKPPPPGPIYGILPQILTELLNNRKKINNRLKDDKTLDSFKKSILNSLQLAYKVTANSLYGQTGAPTSPIYFLPIASSTTAIGRERLYFARDIVEKNFKDSEIVYGDSVTGDTPILFRDGNKDINIISIKELGKIWEPYEQFKKSDSNRKYKGQSKADCEVWTADGWAKVKRVIRHKTVKKIYRILTHTGCVDVTEDHSLLDPNAYIIKPTECEIGTELLHRSVPFHNKYDMITITEAINLGNSISNKEPIPKYLLNCTFEIKQAFVNRYMIGHPDIIGKINAQIIFYLCKSIGLNVSIENVSGSDIFRIVNSIDLLSSQTSIKKIEFISEINYDEYVYDLETESGTFHAGVGEMIVKNTDSIFINFHLKDENGIELTDLSALIKTMELSIQAAGMINAIVPKPQSIVYEKTFWPWILAAKKKYVGLKYELDPMKYVLTSMGIVLKRRDNAPIVKIVVGGIIDYILKTRDIQKALDYTKEVISKLMDGFYPIDKFIISKTLKGNYKKPKSIAHKVLADRMAIRDPGNKPQVNDRIQYVYVVMKLSKKKKKDVLQGDLIEHPEFVLKNGLKIDYLYYLEHQIINPATQILELMVSTKYVDKLFSEFIVTEWNKRLGRQNVDKWIKCDNQEIILPKMETNLIKAEKEPNQKMTKWIQYDNQEVVVPKAPTVKKTKEINHQKMDKWLGNNNSKNLDDDDDWEPTFT